MTTFHCLNRGCSSPLPPPDIENRYCPRCGAIRVLADPPNQPESTRWLKVGYESFGARSRCFYAHCSLVHAPAQVRAFEPLPEDYRSLFPSARSGGALHNVESSPILTGIRKEFGESIADVVVRHGRLWVLFDNGALQAYHLESLEAVATFEKGEWSDSTDYQLSISEHFLYCLSQRQGSWVLRTIDAASGDIEPPALLLDLESPAVFFDSLQGVALGRDRAGRFNVLILRATSGGVIQEDRRSLKVSTGAPQVRPWWGQLGEAEFLLCPDGSLRQWVKEDERYENRWPNEGRAWVGHPHRWKEFLFFPVSGGSSLRFLRVGPTGVVEERELMSRSGPQEIFSSCMIEDQLYFLARDRDARWNLEAYNLVREELEEPRSLGGSQDLLAIELQPCAIEGQTHVLISGRSSTQWVFWGWNVRERNFHSRFAGSPLADERITFHWEGANTWMVRHSVRHKGGLIQCLPI